MKILYEIKRKKKKNRSTLKIIANLHTVTQ